MALLYVNKPQPQGPEEVAVIISLRRITIRITFVKENESIILAIEIWGDTCEGYRCYIPTHNRSSFPFQGSFFFSFFFFNFFLNPIFPILRQEKCDDIAGINRSVGFVNLLRITIYTGREERQSVKAQAVRIRYSKFRILVAFQLRIRIKGTDS